MSSPARSNRLPLTADTVATPLTPESTSRFLAAVSDTSMLPLTVLPLSTDRLVPELPVIEPPAVMLLALATTTALVAVTVALVPAVTVAATRLRVPSLASSPTEPFCPVTLDWSTVRPWPAVKLAEVPAEATLERGVTPLLLCNKMLPLAVATMFPAMAVMMVPVALMSAVPVSALLASAVRVSIWLASTWTPSSRTSASPARMAVLPAIA